MSDNSYRVVRPEDQYKAAPDSDININTNLSQTQVDLIDYDRTVTVNLSTLFDGERQESKIFRPTLKISYIYENNLVGATEYEILRNELYYVNPELSLPLLNGNGIWSGLPSYQEFEFIRTDVDTNQVNFVTKSASSYNWSVTLSYPYENDSSVPMEYYFQDGSSLPSWVSGDGIPFTIENSVFNGMPTIQFKCIVDHGLSIGEYVELSFDYEGITTFQVDGLGNGDFGSDTYIFNIDDVGYTGTTFSDGQQGVFKRIIDITNSAETKSKYYVRKHKIMTNPSDSLITKNGFELNPFKDGSAYQFANLTPNNVSRVAKYQSSNTYNVTFAHDLEIINQIDNNKKPLTQIFATFQNVGYFGWFNKLRKGWNFNVISGQTNPWWDLTNGNAVENNQTSMFSKDVYGNTPCNGRDCYDFTVNLPRQSGDTMYGDWCEWNDYTQKERVVSSYLNKLTYYQKAFNVMGTQTTNPYGYYYQVHYPIDLKSFSSYIETAQNNLVNEVPYWAYFSNNDQQWRWRDVYPYGYIDTDNYGVDYPFLNDCHYPFKNIPFRLFPEGVSFDINQNYTGFVLDPIFDDCE